MPTNPTLTADRLRERLDYDPLTGEFTWRSTGRGYVKGAIAGGTSNGYVSISIDRRSHYAHRLAWLHVHGVWPADQIDHINGNRSDNRMVNLRQTTHQLNHQNSLRTFGPTVSGLRGVSWNKRRSKWQSALTINGRHIFLGYFETPEEGYSAYLAAKQLHHPFWADANLRR